MVVVSTLVAVSVSYFCTTKLSTKDLQDLKIMQLKVQIVTSEEPIMLLLSSNSGVAEKLKNDSGSFEVHVKKHCLIKISMCIISAGLKILL